MPPEFAFGFGDGHAFAGAHAQEVGFELGEGGQVACNGTISDDSEASGAGITPAVVLMCRSQAAMSSGFCTGRSLRGMRRGLAAAAVAAAAGGMAYGATNGFDANSAYDLISRLLAIIIFGGMGSLSGALIASVGMLVVENVTTVVWSPTWASTVFYILLVIILLVRPQGLLGKAEGRKQ